MSNSGQNEHDKEGTNNDQRLMMQHHVGERDAPRPILPMPPWMVGTPLGNRLAQRVLSNDWARVEDADVDDLHKTPVPTAGLQKVDRLLFPAHDSPAAQRRLCVECGAATSTKCSICLGVYYCSRACQESGWRVHKWQFAPYQAGTELHLAVALPDFAVSWRYEAWLHSAPPVPGTVLLAILARDDFADMFGEQNLKRTFLHMAMHGKPACLMVRIGCKVAVLPS